MSILANYWDETGWVITLLTLDDGASPAFYAINPGIRHIPLGLARPSASFISAIRNNMARIWVLRRAIKKSKADAVLSFMQQTNVITLLATRGLNVPVIVSERVHPDIDSMSRIWRLLRAWIYPCAARIVVQTERVKDYFHDRFVEKVIVIPNPVLAVRENVATTRQMGRPTVIAVGRFTEQKNFDLLLRAFARVANRHPDWTLTILGDGPLRPQLGLLCSTLKIADRVYLPGFIKDPHEIVRQADLFVMSSRFEGFPNALCEAMACGLPVISTDCPSGPREIIRDGIDGVLVPSDDVDSLAAAMDRLMGCASERKLLAGNARDVVLRFGLPEIMNIWAEMFAIIIVPRQSS